MWNVECGVWNVECGVQSVELGVRCMMCGACPHVVWSCCESEVVWWSDLW